MPTPSGTISLLDIQNEFGGSSPISLSEYYQLAGYVPGGQGVPGSGVISFNDLRGKTKVVDVTAPASSTLYNVNVRDALIAAGWDKNAPAIYRIPSTTKIFSKRTDTAALLVFDGFPGGLTIVNNGKILGKGGQGGYNYGGFSAGGGPGEAGGAAIDVRTPCTINNLGTIGGGGGGGGSAGSPSAAASYWVQSGGGGGGAGGDNGAAGTSGHWALPTAGNETTGGNGGVGYASVVGGKGGDLGKDGANGGTGTNGGAGGGPGGRGGRAVVGSQHVTWTAYGTIKGGIRESTWVTIAGFYPDEPAITTDAEYYYWGQAAYGSSSNYLYAYTYSRTVWGDYPAVDHADNDYTGPLAFNTANGQTFDWFLFGKNIKMTNTYSDSGAYLSTNGYVGVTKGVYDISKSTNWCVEGWFYPTEEAVSGSSHMTLINLNTNSTYYGLHVWRANGGGLVVDDGVTGRAAFTGASNKKIPLNQWSHVCIERTGGDVHGYIDGVYVGKHVGMNAYPDVINSYKIGCLAQNYQWHFCGYISNVRISKVARYNAGATNFTRPSSAFSVTVGDTDTVLLACATADPTYDASNYRLRARVTGSGTSAQQPGYTRDHVIPGSDAPTGTNSVSPFAGGGSSVLFRGPGAVTGVWDVVGSNYRGYGIMDFPGKLNPTSLMTDSLGGYINPFKASRPAIDRIMVGAQDLKSGYYVSQAGIAPYYSSTGDYTSISYIGYTSLVNNNYPSSRVQWQLQFYNPSLFGGRMVAGIITAPIGSTSGSRMPALTGWPGTGTSGIGSADGSEWLDFSDIINGPGQSAILIGDSNGRNWTVRRGHFKWSNSTNKAFSVEPSLLNYDKT
jgi:hypothetical protein